VARPAEGLFHSEQAVEEGSRAEVGFQLRGRVQEPRLVLEPPGIGLPERGEPARADQLGRAPDRLLPVAEVRAEADVGKGHAASTSSSGTSASSTTTSA